MRLILRVLLPLCCLQFLQNVSAQGPESLLIEGGWAIQTMREQEAVLTNGFQSAAMPQVAIRFEFPIWEELGLRIGGHYFRKGGRVPAVSADFPDSPNAVGFIVLGADILALEVGGFARIPLAKALAFGVAADLVGGGIVGQASRNTLYGPGDPGYKTRLNSFFNQVYLGLHLGASLEWKFAEQFALQLQPTMEFQFNQAFRSSIFVQRFVGFAPLLGIRYYLH